jgi:hypothetical protein
MTKSTIMVLALLQPLLSFAGDKSEVHPKSASFVPHARSNQHVYGAPIAQPIVGHVKASNQKQAVKKRSSGVRTGKTH